MNDKLFRTILKRYEAAIADELDSPKKNTKKKWNNVHLQNYVAIPTILDQFSGHFTGHILV
jgi:hypothetical protein